MPQITDSVSLVIFSYSKNRSQNLSTIFQSSARKRKALMEEYELKRQCSMTFKPEYQSEVSNRLIFASKTASFEQKSDSKFQDVT